MGQLPGTGSGPTTDGLTERPRWAPVHGAETATVCLSRPLRPGVECGSGRRRRRHDRAETVTESPPLPVRARQPSPVLTDDLIGPATGRDPLAGGSAGGSIRLSRPGRTRIPKLIEKRPEYLPPYR